MATFEIHHGDNRDVLKTLADNSVDSVVTDPPYELGFMGKSWDASGIAFNTEVWQECLRVLKPGGHLLAFSGSRTYHRMAVAIEDAGFEIRDQIMWIYGSGFPKSLDVSKAIDKSAGAEREVVGQTTKARSTSGKSALPTVGGETIYETWDETAPATAEAKQWQGWGTALKPAHEPVVVARKPLIGTVAANVLTYGTGGLNIDASRVGSEGGTTGSEYIPNDSPIYGKGLGNTGDIVKLDAGRWPANVIHDGSDEVVALFPILHGSGNKSDTRDGQDKDYEASSYQISYAGRANRDYGSKSRSAARFFYCAKASKRDRNEGLDGFEVKNNGKMMRNANNTSEEPSVGFERFATEPSANHHPTVKPTELMRYLCRLVTPPNGIVLDPFMGSGSTGKAAMYEGFNFVGIEMTDEYIPIAKARIEFAVNEMGDKLL